MAFVWRLSRRQETPSGLSMSVPGVCRARKLRKRKGNPKLELVSEPISWNQNPTRIQGFYQLSFTISQVANMANWFDPFPSRLTPRNPSANYQFLCLKFPYLGRTFTGLASPRLLFAIGRRPGLVLHMKNMVKTDGWTIKRGLTNEDIVVEWKLSWEYIIYTFNKGNLMRYHGI